MTANATTAGQTSESKGLGGVGKVLYIVLVLFVAFSFYKGFYSPNDPGNALWWALFIGWLLVGCLGYILVAISPDKRRFSLFVFLFSALVVLLSTFFQAQLTSNATVGRVVWNSDFLTFLLGTFTDTVIWSLILAFVVALLVIGLPLLAVSYAASVYVLALHEIEDVGRWDAVRYMISLVLGNNLPFIEVENGQALITEEASKINVIGGPGQLIIKQGNVVVLERGGKITRVLNAGVHKLKPLEKIRNIFVLGPQSDSDTIEHVLTKDRIPLAITLGIKVQLEPASDADKRPESRIPPDGEALTPKLDDGMYAVYEGTIRKAALMSQATSFAQREFKKCDEEPVCRDVEETTWKKVAASLPEGELRDHIMSHRFDELFELVDSTSGEKPKVRVDKRKIYEIEQAILEKIKPGKLKGLGVLVRGVDIGKIEFPEGAEQVLIDRWGATWQKQIQLIEAEAKAKGEMRARMLAARGDAEATQLTEEGRLKTVELEAQAIVIRARARAQARILEGQGEGEARAAFFREVLQEMKREEVLGDYETIKAVLRLLISTMVSVAELETFVKAITYLERPSLKRLEPSSEAAGGNGTGDTEGQERSLSET